MTGKKKPRPTERPHALWGGTLKADKTLPYYHEDDSGFVGFCALPCAYPGTRYRMEYPSIGKWHTNPPEKKP